MAIHYNTRSSTNGLISCIDTNNKKSFSHDYNALDTRSWILNTGTVSTFTANGGAAENVRKLDIDPWGSVNLVWEAQPDSVSGADGGWDGSVVPVDKNSLYRLSVWVRRTVQGTSGRFYFGTSGGVLNRSDAAINGNPYFWYSSSPPNTELPTGTWVLVVGHVWPDGSGSGSNHIDSGRYTIDGGKYGNISTDFIWDSARTSAGLRTYLYYCTDITTRQQWVHPRIDKVDGTEPSISSLLQGGPYYANDIIGNTKCRMSSGVKRVDLENGFVFNGSGGLIDIGNLNLTNYSFEFMIKSTGDSLTGSTGYNTLIGYNGSKRLLYLTNGQLLAQVGTGNIFSTGLATRGQWNHIVFTYDNATTTACWYINGMKESFVVSAQSAWNGITYLGSYNSNNYWMNGIMSVAKIYNRSLTDQEVIQNFNALRGRYGI